MKLSAKTTASVAALFVALSGTGSDAFSVIGGNPRAFVQRSAPTQPSSSSWNYRVPTRFLTADGAAAAPRTSPPSSLAALRATTPGAPTETESPPPEASADAEVQRLRSMAAKLRREAARLEAQRAAERATAVERAFEKFDANRDGELTVDELKAALERTFRMDTPIPRDRVQRLMDDLDLSGDGKLQKDEFVGVEQFRSRLESMAREERTKALEASKVAQKEAELSKLIEAQLEMINDRPPSGTDKLVSVLPYLFPLMDGLMFGQFLLSDNTNPVVTALAILYTTYRSIPFSGFIAFFALSTLSGNLSINRLVRFNMQQAIFLDVALFIPGLIGAITTALVSLAGDAAGGLPIPAGIVAEWGSDAIFVALVATVAYATVSSLLGITPDKVPVISDAVNDRLPSIDAMFDAQGRFDPRNNNKNNSGDDSEDNKDQTNNHQKK